MILRQHIFVRLLLILILCLGAKALPAASSTPSKYALTALPPLPGQTSTWASSINNNGDVAGASDDQAVLWQSGSPSDLAPYLGGTSSAALSVNDADEICCRYNSTGVVNAVIYYQGQVTPVDQLGGTNGVAYAINNNGYVTGYSYVANSSSKALTPHAFLWQFGGTSPAIDLGNLGASDSLAFALDDSNLVVGLSGVAVTGSTKALVRAFVYSGGKMNDLGLLTHGKDSVARGVNNLFAVCGQFSENDGKKRGFVYKAGVVTALKPVAGFPDSDALAIGNTGVIVGRSYFETTGRGRATLWIDSKPYDLNSLVASSAESILNSAIAINDNGQIVANGVFHSNKRAVILTPTTPTSP